MKNKMFKRITAGFVMLIMLLSLGGCGSKGLIGKWEYDSSENKDPDIKNVTIEFTDELMYMKTSGGFEDITLEMTYEKDEETIYITGMTAVSATGERKEAEHSDGEEYLKIAYKFLEDKLMLDMTDEGLGKVIMRRAD